jgi:hypothetical protein
MLAIPARRASTDEPAPPPWRNRSTVGKSTSRSARPTVTTPAACRASECPGRLRSSTTQGSAPASSTPRRASGRRSGALPRPSGFASASVQAVALGVPPTRGWRRPGPLDDDDHQGTRILVADCHDRRAGVSGLLQLTQAIQGSDIEGLALPAHQARLALPGRRAGLGDAKAAWHQHMRAELVVDATSCSRLP